MKSFLSVLSQLHDLFVKKHVAPSSENIAENTTNPYIAARHEWNLMYGDIIKAKHNWQQVALLLILTHLVLLIGLIILALQKHVVPYVVQVDKLGNANFSQFLTSQPTPSPLVINAMIRRYIETARTVIADPVAEKHNLDFVYQITKNSARSVLDNYYHEKNPFDIVKAETVDVMINTVLEKSSETWQVDWTETHRDLNGHITNENHFSGLITIEQRVPSRVEEINVNPLGLYVTHLSWATQQ